MKSQKELDAAVIEAADKWVGVDPFVNWPSGGYSALLEAVRARREAMRAPTRGEVLFKETEIHAGWSKREFRELPAGIQRYWQEIANRIAKAAPDEVVEAQP